MTRNQEHADVGLPRNGLCYAAQDRADKTVPTMRRHHDEIGANQFCRIQDCLRRRLLHDVACGAGSRFRRTRDASIDEPLGTFDGSGVLADRIEHDLRGIAEEVLGIDGAYEMEIGVIGEPECVRHDPLGKLAAVYRNQYSRKH